MNTKEGILTLAIIWGAVGFTVGLLTSFTLSIGKLYQMHDIPWEWALAPIPGFPVLSGVGTYVIGAVLMQYDAWSTRRANRTKSPRTRD